jgi:antitoxin component of MazEF toxin-antitoxin module
MKSTLRKSRLRQIGNSQGVTFSRELLQTAGFEAGQDLQIIAVPGEIRVTRADDLVNVALTETEAKAIAAGDTTSEPGKTAADKVRQALVEQIPEGDPA